MTQASGIVEIDRGQTIRLSRRFQAPPALLFRALTEPDRIAQWWGPAGFENTRCDVDLRVGGEFRLYMRAPDSSVHIASGLYVEIDPPRRLVIDGDPMCGHPCGAGLPPRARTVFTIEPDGDGARLILETAFAEETARLAANAGGFTRSWLEGLSRLDEHIAAA